MNSQAPIGYYLLYTSRGPRGQRISFDIGTVSSGDAQSLQEAFSSIADNRVVGLTADSGVAANWRNSHDGTSREMSRG